MGNTMAAAEAPSIVLVTNMKASFHGSDRFKEQRSLCVAAAGAGKYIEKI